MNMEIFDFLKYVKDIRNILHRVTNKHSLITFDDLVIFYKFNEFKVEFVEQLLLQYLIDSPEAKFQIILNVLIKDLKYCNKILKLNFDIFNNVNIESIVDNSLLFYIKNEQNDYKNLQQASKMYDAVLKQLNYLPWDGDINSTDNIEVTKDEEVLKKEYEKFKAIYLTSYNLFNKVREDRLKYFSVDFLKSHQLISNCLSLMENDFNFNPKINKNISDEYICKVVYDLLENLVASEFSLQTLQELIEMKYEEKLKIKSKSKGKFYHIIKEIRQFVTENENSVEVWEKYIIEIFDTNYNTYSNKNDYKVDEEFVNLVSERVKFLKDILAMQMGEN